MKGIVLLALGIAMCLVSGCASLQMATQAEDSAAKEFKVPQDKAAIYVYRNETFGADTRLSLTLDEQMAGETGPKTFLKWEVAPGEHVVKSFDEEVSSIVVVAKAGQAHFLKQEMQVGTWLGRSRLYEVTEAEGKEAVKECSMAKSVVVPNVRIQKLVADDLEP